MNNVGAACQDIKQKLSEYLDGDLDPAVCDELERHLNGCENCQVVVDTLVKTILVYRNCGRTPAPAAAHARFIRVLDLDACIPMRAREKA